MASTLKKPRVAVVGAGSFGRNHLRVIHQSEHAELAAVLDTNQERAAEAAGTNACPVLTSLEELAGKADAAVVATPTHTHAEIGRRLMELGLDVLIEKPIAATLARDGDPSPREIFQPSRESAPLCC